MPEVVVGEGNEVPEDAVTEVLGVSPSHLREKGEKRGVKVTGYLDILLICLLVYLFVILFID